MSNPNSNAPRGYTDTSPAGYALWYTLLRDEDGNSVPVGNPVCFYAGQTFPADSIAASEALVAAYIARTSGGPSSAEINAAQTQNMRDVVGQQPTAQPATPAPSPVASDPANDPAIRGDCLAFYLADAYRKVNRAAQDRWCGQPDVNGNFNNGLYSSNEIAYFSAGGAGFNPFADRIATAIVFEGLDTHADSLIQAARDASNVPGINTGSAAYAWTQTYDGHCYDAAGGYQLVQ